MQSQFFSVVFLAEKGAAKSGIGISGCLLLLAAFVHVNSIDQNPSSSVFFSGVKVTSNEASTPAEAIPI
ncbi:MAG: hypothetical protein P4L38_13735 [Syntrophaceae bacterium]|nr:hypothetical protein [Syntrophaceae bacterium]